LVGTSDCDVDLAVWCNFCWIPSYIGITGNGVLQSQ